MITATHAILFADDAVAARAFLRDVLQLEHVDSHDGWLIFKLPPAEMGVHPTDAEPPSGQCELYLMCDDIERTVAELETRGVEFTAAIEDRGFGRVTSLRVPGAGEIGLYEPRHAVVYNL